MSTMSPASEGLIAAVQDFCDGGKRARAMLSWWGCELAGAEGQKALKVAVALELLHAAALVHDDIIDESDTRRGKPSMHAHFRAHHTRNNWAGRAPHYGQAVAIIAGDLLLGFADELIGAQTEHAAAVRALYDTLRTEVMVGQFLDVELQTLPVDQHALRARAEEVLIYKSAKYTVEQPLVLGAKLGGAPPAVLDVLSSFGLMLGRGFQLRDDLLGVFGEPEITGKPVGDDLEQGKCTLLVAEVLDRADPQSAQRFTRALRAPDTSPHEVQDMIALTIECGARDAIEAEITAVSAHLDEELERMAALKLDPGRLADLRTYSTDLLFRSL